MSRTRRVTFRLSTAEFARLEELAAAARDVGVGGLVRECAVRYGERVAQELVESGAAERMRPTRSRRRSGSSGTTPGGAESPESPEAVAERTGLPLSLVKRRLALGETIEG